jgi:hypothetical protein
MRHHLRHRYGHAAVPAKLKWHFDGVRYDAVGLFGKYRIWPGSHRAGYSLMWENTYGWPAEHDGLKHDLGNFGTVAAAKAAVKKHIKELQSTAVG